MVMVEPDVVVVEARLAAGELVCPGCGGRLGPWGFARWRVLRDGDRRVGQRPRRSICGVCGVTHVLLPTVALLRRRWVASAVGQALLDRFATGMSQEAVAERVGAHPDTVRGWLRRFVANAGQLRVGFVALAHRLDPLLGPVAPQATLCRDALEAIGVAAAAAARSLGPSPLWWFVSGATGGRLLSNTSVTVAGPQ